MTLDIDSDYDSIELSTGGFDDNKAVVQHVDDDFGMPGSKKSSLVKGKEYTYKIKWIATDPAYQFYPLSNYDWQALINGSTATGVREGLYGTGRFIVEDPDNLLTYITHGNETDITIGKEGTIIVPKVDLDIWNGGGNLDNGEAVGLQGSQVLENDEESIGSYLLVNWDDDDGDGEINAAGKGWTSLPKPDFDESTAITDEDNLAQLKPNLEPMSDTGTVELEVSGVDASKVKLWEKKTKETEVILTSNKKAWDLSNSTQKSEFEAFIANSFWIEGVEEGSTERAVTFTLRYKDSDGTEICNDVNKATIVMLNLGNVVGREVNSDALAERGHTSIVGRYNGVCMKASLTNASHYTLYESDGSDNWGGTEPGSQEALLTHITACPDRDYFGSLTPFLTSYYNSFSMQNTVAGYTMRLKILLVARRLIDNTASIGYTKFNTVLPGSWNGNLSTVTDLRCDGFVEVCYEWCDVNSWGRIVGGTAQYNLLTVANQDDHNEWSWGDDPEDGDSDFWAWLMPVTQIGYADTYIASHYPPYSGGDFNYTSNNFEGTFWESSFSEQQLVKPTL